MHEYGFQERLQFSRGRAESTHPETIKKLLVGCVKVEKATVQLDRAGIDYIASLRGGAPVNIDLKMREQGCSKFWKKGIFESSKRPELALEKWSVLPENGNPGKAGWTLDESKLTDYTLHVFDSSDTDEVFLLPFQILRMTFRENLEGWWKQYRSAIQSSGSWKSQCLFVPADIVLDAIKTRMRSIPEPREYMDDGDPLNDTPEFKTAMAAKKTLIDYLYE